MKSHLRQLCLPLAVLAVAGLTACGSSSKDDAAAPQATGATSTSASSTPSPTPTPSPSGLSKAEFVTKMNAVCKDFDAKVGRLPEPSSMQDYASLITSAQGTLALFPQYVKQADVLVAQSGDKASLTTNWLTVEKSDFAALQPVLKKFIVDLKAQNQAALAADSKALDQVPDHSKALATFLSGYGLASCAKLEDS